MATEGIAVMYGTDASKFIPGLAVNTTHPTGISFQSWWKMKFNKVCQNIVPADFAEEATQDRYIMFTYKKRQTPDGNPILNIGAVAFLEPGGGHGGKTTLYLTLICSVERVPVSYAVITRALGGGDVN